LPQRLLPSLALPIAVMHIDHILNQCDLEFPNLHPLQLGELTRNLRSSKPA
jgi:hypothetical protein